jgi:hypothetical protein
MAMQHIGGKLVFTASKVRETERGELMKYFCEELNATRLQDGYDKITMPRMGKILESIPTKDLYYIKRVCRDSKSFSKTFWWLLDPSKHGDESGKARQNWQDQSRRR